jgi:hypothetical protein
LDTKDKELLTSAASVKDLESKLQVATENLSVAEKGQQAASTLEAKVKDLEEQIKKYLQKKKFKDN